LAATFNSMIHELAWGELPLTDRLYTWTNRQASPVLARLDRVFLTPTGTRSSPTPCCPPSPVPHPITTLSSSRPPQPSPIPRTSALRTLGSLTPPSFPPPLLVGLLGGLPATPRWISLRASSATARWQRFGRKGTSLFHVSIIIAVLLSLFWI
jgi:hypothetical protein